MRFFFVPSFVFGGKIETFVSNFDGFITLAHNFSVRFTWVSMNVVCLVS